MSEWDPDKNDRVKEIRKTYVEYEKGIRHQPTPTPEQIFSAGYRAAMAKIHRLSDVHSEWGRNYG